MENIVKGDLSTLVIRCILEKDGYALFSLMVGEVLPAVIESLHQLYKTFSYLRTMGYKGGVHLHYESELLRKQWHPELLKVSCLSLKSELLYYISVSCSRNSGLPSS